MPQRRWKQRSEGSKVAEMIAAYFTNAAWNIAGDNVINLTEEDHNNVPYGTYRIVRISSSHRRTISSSH